MKYRHVLAAWFAGIVCLSPLAGISHAAGPSQVSKTGQAVAADADVNELLFGEAGSGYFYASERQFAVTTATAFYGKNGAKTSLSSIRKGSMVKVVFRREADGSTLTAISVTVTKDHQ